MQILAFVGIVWLLATVYVNHSDMPDRVTQWVLKDFRARLPVLIVVSGVLVMMVSFINN